MNSIIENKYFNKNDFYIQEITVDIAKEFIIKNHYSHKWTLCSYSFGIFSKNKPTNINYKKLGNSIFNNETYLVGVIIYGGPVGRQTVKSICSFFEGKNVLELTRLFIYDGYGKNIESYFISQTINILRKKETDLKVIISYSDPEYNHLGVIYQACNFLYQGNQTRLAKNKFFKLKGTDEWVHPRTIFVKYQTNDIEKLKKQGFEFEIKEVSFKHRYIYILRDKKYILDNLKHKILKYPKKEK